MGGMYAAFICIYYVKRWGPQCVPLPSQHPPAARHPYIHPPFPLVKQDRIIKRYPKDA